MNLAALIFFLSLKSVKFTKFFKKVIDVSKLFQIGQTTDLFN